MKIGFGYDIHRLKEGEKLVIGGVNIDYDYGLIGHSDADVLIHSLIDSIFGAFAMGDIGTHFPDDAEAYKGISSLVLLEKTMEMIAGQIINIDATIVAEKPKLSGYIRDMIRNISRVTGIIDSSISIKAKTSEGIGEIGKGKAISSYCVSMCRELEL